MADEGLDKKICSVCNFMVISSTFKHEFGVFPEWTPHLTFFFPCQEKSKSEELLFGPGLTFFCHALSLLSFTGSLAFTVGGDTVISSCTWKRESQRRYYFNLCRIFTKKDLFLWKKKFIFRLGIFFPSSFFRLSEKPVELKCPMPLAFAILCNGLVYMCI